MSEGLGEIYRNSWEECESISERGGYSTAMARARARVREGERAVT